MFILTDLNPILLMASFCMLGWITAVAGIASAIGGVVASGKASKQAKAQIAWEKEVLAQQKAESARATIAGAEKRKSNLLLVSIGGGSVLMAVFLFKR